MVENRLHSLGRLLAVAALAGVAYAGTLAFGQNAANQPQPGLSAALSRNQVNLKEKNLPTDWNVEEGKFKNIKWSATIGNRDYGSPVIAGGRVWVSTNNKNPRDPKIDKQKAVIMCFDQATGKFLYQVVHPMPPPEVDQQAHEDGMCSIPTVEGDRFYYVTPGCVVVCADVKDGKAQWTYDLMKELKVYPCIINSCSPLVVGDLVYVVTANGTDDNGKVESPKAPSFVAIEKKTGKLKWQNNLPGDKIIYGQWGNAAYAEVGGKGQVIFPGGDGYLYSLEPDTGNMIWKFRCIPYKGDTKEEELKPNYLVATPVVYGNRVYIGTGHAPDAGPGNRVGRLWCVDITKKGDVSPAKDNFFPNAPENKNSALVWHYGGLAVPGGNRKFVFGPTLSSCAIHDGLLYVAEEPGYLHCLDAATGGKYWEHDLKAAIWGSPYWADGKIYVGAEDGTFAIFAHGKMKNVIAELDMNEPVLGSPAAADGVLFVTSKTKLYAIGAK